MVYNEYRDKKRMRPPPSRQENLMTQAKIIHLRKVGILRKCKSSEIGYFCIMLSLSGDIRERLFVNSLKWQQAIPTGIADALIWVWFLQTAYLSRFTDQVAIMRELSNSLPFLATGIAVAVNVFLMAARWNAIPAWYRMACGIGSAAFTGGLLLTDLFGRLDSIAGILVYSLFVIFYCGSQILRTETLAKSPNSRTLMLTLIISFLAYYCVSALLLVLPLAAYNLAVTVLPLALLYRTLRPLSTPTSKIPESHSFIQSFFNIPTLLLILFGISGGLITSTGGSNPAITLTGLFSMPDPMHLVMVLANLGLGILAAASVSARRGMYFAFMNLIWMTGTYLGAFLLQIMSSIPTAAWMVLAGAIGLAIIVSFLVDRKMWLGKDGPVSCLEENSRDRLIKALNGPHENGFDKDRPSLQVSENESVLTSEFLTELEEPKKPVDKVSALTQGKELTRREREILELLLEGRSVPIICERLVISEGTARTHVKHIYQKLDVHNRQELLDLVEK